MTVLLLLIPETGEKVSKLPVRMWEYKSKEKEACSYTVGTVFFICFYFLPYFRSFLVGVKIDRHVSTDVVMIARSFTEMI